MGPAIHIHPPVIYFFSGCHRCAQHVDLKEGPGQASCHQKMGITKLWGFTMIYQRIFYEK